MPKPALLAAFLFALALAPAPLQAQDIVGLEDCSKATSADKKTGCLQANVGFLHGLIRKNDAAAQAQAKSLQAQLTAASAEIAALRADIGRLNKVLEQLETKLPKK